MQHTLSGRSATACLLAATLFAAFTTTLPAQPARPRPAAARAAKLRLADDSAEANLLRQAYSLLASADHDYDGRRAKAMKEVSSAAKSLGVKLRGDGKVREDQATSDEQLRAAKASLEQVVTVVGGVGLNHIQSAIEHLNVALNIR
jgi:hypothetical protein